MKSYCLLQLRGNTCGVDLVHVKEVLPALPLTQVPLGPECLLGAANLRSEIISVFAIESLLQSDESDTTGTAGAGEQLPQAVFSRSMLDSGSEDRFLILQYEEFTFGVRVRRVDTVRLPDEAEPLNAELADNVLLHPLMQFEGYSFQVIELDHLVERLRIEMHESLRM